jgi:hypothetical protein
VSGSTTSGASVVPESCQLAILVPSSTTSLSSSVLVRLSCRVRWSVKESTDVYASGMVVLAVPSASSVSAIVVGARYTVLALAGAAAARASSASAEQRSKRCKAHIGTPN